MVSTVRKRGNRSCVPQLWDGEMGIEARKGRFYLYDRRRENGRVRCEYLGAVPPHGVQLLRLTAENERAKRAKKRWEAEGEVKWADELLATGSEFDGLADRLFRVVMLLTGHCLHRRSEWRRTRGVAAMGKLEEIAPAPKGAKEFMKTLMPKPDERAIFERAEKGDWSVVPQVRELLKSPVHLDTYGNVSERSLGSILVQAAGDNVAVLMAMGQKYHDFIEKLLADGPAPNYAEQIAATRAALNWLTVHALEVKAAKFQPGSSTAMMIDKRVTLAERRLHASLKSLAVLRRLRKPVVLKQVNSAPSGTVVVKN